MNPKMQIVELDGTIQTKTGARASRPQFSASRRKHFVAPSRNNLPRQQQSARRRLLRPGRSRSPISTESFRPGAEWWHGQLARSARQPAARKSPRKWGELVRLQRNVTCAVPSGQWPDGTGWQPVPPIPIQVFEQNQTYENYEFPRFAALAHVPVTQPAPT